MMPYTFLFLVFVSPGHHNLKVITIIFLENVLSQRLRKWNFVLYLFILFYISSKILMLELRIGPLAQSAH